MTAATAYIHCVPAVGLDESYPHSGLHSAAGVGSYDVQRGRGRQHSTLAVVDLSIDDCKDHTSNKQRQQSRYISHNPKRQAGQQKGFPVSNSSRVQQQLKIGRMSAGTFERGENQLFLNDATKEEKTKAQSKTKRRSSEGSACATVERVYKPTLPKYCFSASTYQSVLTDYSTSAEMGVVRSDISQLPPPRHTLMTRELPYVYRYKIQQGISLLNNMIPNKRTISQPTDQIW